MITKSDTIAAIAPAMVKAQSLVRGAVKDAENPGFKREGKALKYADLESVWEACREAVKGADLAIIQSPGLVIDGHMRMETMILHTSGEFICGELSIPLGKADAQGYGSATTYARRYALAAMMAVCPEDDDGNAASEPRQQRDNRQSNDRGSGQARGGEGRSQNRDAPDPAIVYCDKLKGLLKNCAVAADIDELLEKEASGIARLRKERPPLYAEFDHAKGMAFAAVDDVPF